MHRHQQDPGTLARAQKPSTQERPAGQVKRPMALFEQQSVALVVCPGARLDFLKINLLRCMNCLDRFAQVFTGSCCKSRTQSCMTVDQGCKGPSQGCWIEQSFDMHCPRNVVCRALRRRLMQRKKGT